MCCRMTEDGPVNNPVDIRQAKLTLTEMRATGVTGKNA